MSRMSRMRSDRGSETGRVERLRRRERKRGNQIQCADASGDFLFVVYKHYKRVKLFLPWGGPDMAPDRAS
jgi:hypothetical protein